MTEIQKVYAGPSFAGLGDFWGPWQTSEGILLYANTTLDVSLSFSVVASLPNSFYVEVEYLDGSEFVTETHAFTSDGGSLTVTVDTGSVDSLSTIKYRIKSVLTGQEMRVQSGTLEFLSGRPDQVDSERQDAVLKEFLDNGNDPDIDVKDEFDNVIDTFKQYGDDVTNALYHFGVELTDSVFSVTDQFGNVLSFVDKTAQTVVHGATSYIEDLADKVQEMIDLGFGEIQGWIGDVGDSVGGKVFDLGDIDLNDLTYKQVGDALFVFDKSNSNWYNEPLLKIPGYFSPGGMGDAGGGLLLGEDGSGNPLTAGLPLGAGATINPNLATPDIDIPVETSPLAPDGSPISSDPLNDAAQGVGNSGGVLWDPLVIDLDDDGSIEFSSGLRYFFDMDDDGFAEDFQGVSADDGYLVWDENENGKVDGGSELFGNQTMNGFDELALYDSNLDGKIDSSDTIWTDLKIWRDDNQDGASQVDELYTLGDFNIQSILLSYGASTQIDTTLNDVTHDGAVTYTDLSTGLISNVNFTIDQINTIYVGDYDLDIRSLFLPTFRGYNTVANLHIESSIDSDLLDDVSALAQYSAVELMTDYDSIRQEFEEMLWKWAGVDGVGSTSRGEYIDGRVLAFLETLTASEFVSRTADPNPGSLQADGLMEDYNRLVSHYFTAFFVQSDALSVYGDDNLSYDSLYDTLSGDAQNFVDTDVVDDVSDFIATLSTTGEREAAWSNVLKFYDAVFQGVEGDLPSFVYSATETMLDSAITASDATLDFDDIYDLTYNRGETWAGTSGDDTHTGTSKDDVIDGGDGADTLNGGDGADVINGGDGNDIIDGGIGQNVIDGGAGDDTITTSGDGSHLIGGDGNDTFIVSIGSPSGAQTLAEGGAGDDLYYLGASFYAIDTSGNDTVFLGFTSFSDHGVSVRRVGGGTDLEIKYFSASIILADMFPTSGGPAFENYILDSLNPVTKSFITDFDLDLDTYGTTGNDTIYGSTLGTQTDVIYAAGGNDIIYANEGNDTVSGQDGDDIIYGGNGDDYLDGGSGVNTLYGGDGNDALYNANTVYGGDGNDSIQVSDYSQSGLITIDGGDGNDDVISNSYNLDYYLSHGTDVVTASAFGEGVRTLHLRAGQILEDVTLIRTGSSFTDLQISFGNHETTFLGHFAGNSLTHIELDDETVYDITTMQFITQGTSGNDTINGISSAYGSVDDIIYGNDGDDTINGGIGDDILDGGNDDDTVSGGSGSDTYIYSSGLDTFNEGHSYSTEEDIILLNGYSISDITSVSAAGAYNFDLRIVFNSGVDEILIQNQFNTYTIEKIVDANGDELSLLDADDWVVLTSSSESYTSGSTSLTILGQDGDDNIYGDNTTDTDDIIYGGDGDDFIRTWGGNDIVYGGDGIDTIYLDDGNDVAYGGNGNDVINGGDGDDEIHGGEGMDTLRGNGGTDVIYGDGGDDTIFGHDEVDTIYGGSGNDTIKGGDSDDLLYGDDGDDIIFGQNDNDTIYGGDGEDLIRGDAGHDYVYGDGDDDAVYGHSGNDHVYGGDGNDYLYGDDGNFTEWGDDFLFGDDGDDYLFGGDGTDRLEGGAGQDHLTGGNDDDTFVIDETSFVGAVDQITDFDTSEGDKLDISNILIGYDSGTDDIADFVSFTDSGADSIMAVDRDGAGTTYSFENVARLLDLNGLSASTLETNGNLIT